MDLTLVFFERKDRLASTLETASRALGKREVCIARELTKTHEEFLRFPLADYAAALPDALLGEITVILGPPEAGARSPAGEADAVLAEEAALGGKPRDIAARARQRLQGWSGKELYDRLRGIAAPGEEA
jgi:16S rRNA (cytidine1402-2'-O)-methyltransferase